MNRDDTKTFLKVLLPILLFLLVGAIALLFFVGEKTPSSNSNQSKPEETENPENYPIVTVHNAKYKGRVVKDGNVGILIEAEDSAEVELFNFVQSGASETCQDFQNRTMRIEFKGDKIISCVYDGFIEKEDIKTTDKALYDEIVEAVGKGNIFDVLEVPGAGLDVLDYNEFIPEEHIQKTIFMFSSEPDSISIQLHVSDSNESALEIYKLLRYDLWNGSKVIKTFVEENKTGRVVCSNESLANKLLEIIRRH